MLTTQDLKHEIMEELKCPVEFVKHLTRCGVFQKLKRAVLSGDKCDVQQIRKTMGEDYSDYCRNAGLNPDADNMNREPGYFIFWIRRKN